MSKDLSINAMKKESEDSSSSVSVMSAKEIKQNRKNEYKKNLCNNKLCKAIRFINELANDLNKNRSFNDAQVIKAFKLLRDNVDAAEKIALAKTLVTDTSKINIEDL